MYNESAKGRKHKRKYYSAGARDNFPQAFDESYKRERTHLIQFKIRRTDAESVVLVYE